MLSFLNEKSQNVENRPERRDWSFKKISRDFQNRNSAPWRLRASQINPLKRGLPIKGFTGIGGSIPTRGWLTSSSRQDSSDKKISILFRVAYFTPLSWTSPKPHEKPLAWKMLLVACKRCLKTVKKMIRKLGRLVPQVPAFALPEIRRA